MRCLSWIALLALATGACAPKSDRDDDDEQGKVDSSCSGASAHLWEVCAVELGNDFAEVTAEQFRIDCIAMQGFYDREARCAARSESCEELLRCGISSVEFICETDEDCGEGILCEAPSDNCGDCVPDSDCVACLDDTDCEDGKSCALGLCLQDTNSYHQLAAP